MKVINKFRFLLTITLTLMFGLFTGFALGKSHLLKSQDKFYNEFHKTSNDYEYISPLLSCGNPASTQLNNLKDKINQKINSYNNVNHVSVYFRDLNNGPWFGINQDELFSPASLVKVPLMIAYYKLAQDNPQILNQRITNNLPDFTDDQNIKPKKTIVPQQEYSIDELIETMIIYSDNNAYELLSSNIDDLLFKKTFDDLGIDIEKAYSDPAGNIISVKSYASFFRILYNASYLNEQMSYKALKLLTQTQYDQGIIAGVNSQIKVAHKFGERVFPITGEKQLHDCGIVYMPDKPYLLCIMTRGQDFNILSSTIEDISNQIYSYLQDP